MPSSPYAHVWEFEVGSEAEEEFRHQYGVQGAWARLFRRSPAYIETLLLKDRHMPGRYLTIDRWRTAADYEAFLQSHAEEYDELDRRCAGLTISEKSLGAYTEVGQ
jgi:heme-degrading monooxygenase HmoA